MQFSQHNYDCLFVFNQTNAQDDPNLFPVYEKLNICLTGFDYPVIQKFQGYVYRVCECLEIDIDDTLVLGIVMVIKKIYETNFSYPMPTRSWRTQVFKRGSVAVQAEFSLAKYERIIQVSVVVVIIIVIDVYFIVIIITVLSIYYYHRCSMCHRLSCHS